jgi:spectinomycin phosphotransferase
VLERPDVPDDAIVAALARDFEISAVRVAFLPLGADPHAASYRADAADGSSWFVKMRRGGFSEVAIALPALLAERGIREVVAPVAPLGRYVAEVGDFGLAVQRFVEGGDGYETKLTAAHWRTLGAALRKVHAIDLPAHLAAAVRHETFGARWADELLLRLDGTAADPPALAALLEPGRSRLVELAHDTRTLGARLHARPAPLVLCHADLHAGNVLVGADGALALVDWDDPCLAPKECDLAFVGAGYFGLRSAVDREPERFGHGYGAVEIDATALAYCRRSRVAEDVALFLQEIRDPATGAPSRAKALAHVAAILAPGGPLDIALATEMRT